MGQDYLKETQENFKVLSNFFIIVANLKKIPRQGWVNKLEISHPESVADHSYSMTMMAMVLSDLDSLDTNKILKMSLLHDLAESITGDLTPNEISKNEKKNLENKTMKEILDKLPKKISKKYYLIWNEYQEQKSNESIFLHEVDRLEMALQAKIYSTKGYSKEKINDFFSSAKTEIENPDLKKLLNKILGSE